MWSECTLPGVGRSLLLTLLTQQGDLHGDPVAGWLPRGQGHGRQEVGGGAGGGAPLRRLVQRALERPVLGLLGQLRGLRRLRGNLGGEVGVRLPSSRPLRWTRGVWGLHPLRLVAVRPRGDEARRPPS